MGAVKTIAILMATLKAAASAYAAQKQRYEDAYNTLREAGVERPLDSTTAATLSDDLVLAYAELLGAERAQTDARSAMWAAERAVAEAVNG
jgi:hypothetical protein